MYQRISLKVQVTGYLSLSGQTRRSGLKTFFTFSLASPVHIVGVPHPQIAQPSKVLSLFPRPVGTEGLVLGHMGNLAGSKETARSYPVASKSGMTSPLAFILMIQSLTFLCLQLSLSVCDVFQMSVDRCLYP